jgi:hypothetical protein
MGNLRKYVNHAQPTETRNAGSRLTYQVGDNSSYVREHRPDDTQAGIRMIAA